MSIEQPCERKLCWRAVLACGDLANAIHDRKIALEVLALKTRVVAPPVIGGEIVEVTAISATTSLDDEWE